MMRDRVLSWLANNVSPHRLQHLLGVEQVCVELASCYQVDARKTSQAGLMHDLVRLLPPTQLLQLAAQDETKIEPIYQVNPHLLQVDVSAIITREGVGVQDWEDLSAICNHTLDSPNLSDLSDIVFVADAIKPNCGNSAELAAIRCLSHNHLAQSVQQIGDYSLRSLILGFSNP